MNQLQSLQIRSKNSADVLDLQKNIRYNLENIKEFIKPCYQHDGKVIICSARAES